ncbi:hypothetical protein ACWPM1_09715 [Tsuneonella sp. HG249]
MTNKPRRARTDSVANLHRIFAGANIEVAPPAHVPLADNDYPYWFSIVSEYAKADWSLSPHALEIAAFLARTMASLEEQQRLLSVEGPLTVKPNGTFGPNARNRVVAQLHGQVLALRRTLGLTSRAKAGGSKEAARQRDHNRAAELDNHDDLLA